MSPVACSPQVTGLPESSASCIAIWVMKRSEAAPCQWSSPGSKKTRSPGWITGTLRAVKVSFTVPVLG
jgi:hypothetical protein